MGSYIEGEGMILASVFVIMLLYLFTARRYVKAKYWVEIFYVLLALLFSIVIKAVVIFQTDFAVEGIMDNGWKVFLSIISAIYGAIGGLQFEGLAYELGIFSKPIMAYLYVGSSLVAGGCFLGIITFKSSYELLSGTRLVFRTPKREAFVFSELTEDTLSLARSIKSRFVDEKKKYLIIFGGYNLPPFNRRDSLTREAMREGFYYISLIKDTSGKNKDASIIRRLRLSGYKKIHIFAFATKGDRRKADENENMSFVFDEMGKNANQLWKKIFSILDKDTLERLKAEIEEKLKAEEKLKTEDFLQLAILPLAKKETRVFYYILADINMDYAFYERQTDNELFGENISKKYLESIGRLEKKASLEYRKRIGQIIKTFIQLNVVNEAAMSARSFTKKRFELLKNDYFAEYYATKDDKDNGKPVAKDVMIPIGKEDDRDEQRVEYNVMCLGFGETAQAALTTLYVDSAFIYKDQDGYKTNDFYVDAFDTNIADYAGVFTARHPLFQNVTCTFNESSEIGSCRCQKPTPSCPVVKASKAIKYIYGEKSKALTKAMSFPRIRFFNENCTDIPFFERLDRQTGDSKASLRYNTIIIALGSDEKNILVANALIADIRRELSRNTECTRMQTIAVHLRESTNYLKIEPIDERYGLRVLLFGQADELYSYDSVIDKRLDMRYHKAYSRVAKAKTTEKNEELSEVKGSYSGDDAIKRVIGIFYKPEQLKSIGKGEEKGKDSDIDDYTSKQAWNTLALFKKESNYGARRFAPVYQWNGGNDQFPSLCKDGVGKALSEDDKWCYFIRLEHERWVRFHIANGWIYREERNDSALEHTMLRSTDALIEEIPSTFANDMMNIVVAKSFKSSSDGQA